MEGIYRWGYVFLSINVSIPFGERIYLTCEAIDMALHDVSKRHIKRETYEGTLCKKGGYQSLGTFSGQCFEAELDSKIGRGTLSFLVTEHIRSSLN